ncbi:MAG: DUF2085 domain-containing protein [Candidatus Micrarchaeia archaeon]
MSGFLLEALRWSALAMMIVYVALVALAPFLIQQEGMLLGLGAFVFLFNTQMCHELPQRMLFLFGQQMALDARSTSIFLGAILGYLAIFFHKKLPAMLSDKWIAAASLVPMAVDGLTQLAGWRESDLALRIFTGSIAGFFITYATLARAGESKEDRMKGIAAALMLSVLILLLIIPIAYVLGNTYHSKEELLSSVRAQSPAPYYAAFYIAPNAFAGGIAGDPYLPSYNDTILSDAARFGSPAHPNGAWAIAALPSPPEKNGKAVFLSNTRGTFYYFDAMSGELVAKIERA